MSWRGYGGSLQCLDHSLWGSRCWIFLSWFLSITHWQFCGKRPTINVAMPKFYGDLWLSQLKLRLSLWPRHERRTTTPRKVRASFRHWAKAKNRKSHLQRCSRWLQRSEKQGEFKFLCELSEHHFFKQLQPKLYPTLMRLTSVYQFLNTY